MRLTSSPSSSTAAPHHCPARACGRRSRHTRRYVSTLISLARAMDIGALDRLQTHARQLAHGESLGLGALTQTLMLPPGRRRLPGGVPGHQ